MSLELKKDVDDFTKRIKNSLENPSGKSIQEMLKEAFPSKDDRFLSYCFWNLTHESQCVTAEGINGFCGKEKSKHKTTRNMGRGLVHLARGNKKNAGGYFLKVLDAVESDANFMCSIKGLIVLKVLQECGLIAQDEWERWTRQLKGLITQLDGMSNLLTEKLA